MDKDGKPRWWDLPGRVRYGITSWFRGLVEDALNPMLELIGKTVLATPQIAGQERVGDLWLISLGIADALLILFVLAGAALVMTHETLHTRYALKEMLPRIALAAILVNASLSLSGQMIAAANALSGGFLAGGVDPGEASLQLKHFILGAVAGSGIFVILLGLVAAALAVFLFILYVVRAALILILVAGAPLMLLMHALPQTDGLARLWWRGMTAALGVQVAQALVLATAVRVFFTSGGREALGLSVTGNLIDLLVCLCLFWILIKIPFWAKDLAFSPGRSAVVQIARSYVMAKGVQGAVSERVRLPGRHRARGPARLRPQLPPARDPQPRRAARLRLFLLASSLLPLPLAAAAAAPVALAGARARARPPRRPPRRPARAASPPATSPGRAGACSPRRASRRALPDTPARPATGAARPARAKRAPLRPRRAHRRRATAGCCAPRARASRCEARRSRRRSSRPSAAS